MVRTKADAVTARVSGGKMPSKIKAQSQSRSSPKGEKKGSGFSSGAGNPYCLRETPAWQKEITKFFFPVKDANYTRSENSKSKKENNVNDTRSETPKSNEEQEFCEENENIDKTNGTLQKSNSVDDNSDGQSDESEMLDESQKAEENSIDEVD